MNHRIASYPEVFQVYLFNFCTVWDHLQKSTYEGAWAETVYIVTLRMTVEEVGHGFLGSSKLLIFFPYSVKF